MENLVNYVVVYPKIILMCPMTVWRNCIFNAIFCYYPFPSVTWRIVKGTFIWMVDTFTAMNAMTYGVNLFVPSNKKIVCFLFHNECYFIS